MAIFLIIVSALLWLLSIWTLYGRQALSPALSYVALVLISFAQKDGYPLLPVNGTILTTWLCMTLLVMFTVYLQPVPVRRQTRGMIYIIVGGITGLAVGLLGFTFTTSPGLIYSCMILGTVVGIFLGFLMYTNTPEGRPVGFSSGNFFRYLLAKGFPTAITLMQLGVVLVLWISMSKVNAL